MLLVSGLLVVRRDVLVLVSVLVGGRTDVLMALLVFLSSVGVGVGVVSVFVQTC